MICRVEFHFRLRDVALMVEGLWQQTKKEGFHNFGSLPLLSF